MRTVRWTSLGTLALAGLAVGAPAQAPPPVPPVKAGAASRATHAPQPRLAPLAAWAHVIASHAAQLQARAAATSSAAASAAPAERPAGAGRFVTAVFVCTDAGLDVPRLLGLAPQNVLLFSNPGPFVPAEAIAMLEHAVAVDRLSLVLVLTHRECKTLAAADSGSSANATLRRRLAVAAHHAEQRRQSLTQAFAALQREQILAASEPLRAAIKHDDLRIVPGQVDAKTGTIDWQHDRADALPLAPVK